VDASLKAPPPSVIGLFDDMLTTGAHFRASEAVLQKAFPGVRIIGLFIARRVPESSNTEDFL
jgi:predicted amidophosphoribosyltransferase